MRRFDGSRLKVLVVEDNEHFRVLIRTVLRTLNIQDIREASDGSTALAVLESFPADLILLDYKMTPMDGISFALKLRRSPDSPNPFAPMIMVTGCGDPNLAREATDAGIDEFLVKPLSANAMIKRVASVVTRERTFIRTGTYVGPDRRRGQVGFEGPERRRRTRPEVGKTNPEDGSVAGEE